jgi:hypothetical protein
MAVTTAATVVVRWDSDVRGCGAVQAMQVLDIVASHLAEAAWLGPAHEHRDCKAGIPRLCLLKLYL